MNTDNVLALAEQTCGSTTIASDTYWTFNAEQIERFAALLQQQMVAGGWRSPEQLVRQGFFLNDNGKERK